jgi:hypothetical protein
MQFPGGSFAPPPQNRLDSSLRIGRQVGRQTPLDTLLVSGHGKENGEIHETTQEPSQYTNVKSWCAAAQAPNQSGNKNGSQSWTVEEGVL